ncbi:hypothetical protein L1987_04900 [Smallanthus sonchifolius]|uniref:Uncharacterized protein n=1 Tax=Smallanthus sonchifolius TaxID=185202 RepID=A0ACB9JTV3_9ASTR|nr:hypothetical protein L1987_04900 [Smallanthus sonchifolius]
MGFQLSKDELLYQQVSHGNTEAVRKLRSEDAGLELNLRNWLVPAAIDTIGDKSERRLADLEDERDQRRRRLISQTFICSYLRITIPVKPQLKIAITRNERITVPVRKTNCKPEKVNLCAWRIDPYDNSGTAEEEHEEA